MVIAKVIIRGLFISLHFKPGSHVDFCYILKYPVVTDDFVVGCLKATREKNWIFDANHVKLAPRVRVNLALEWKILLHCSTIN